MAATRSPHPRSPGAGASGLVGDVRDDRGERDLLAVAMPPLRFTEVAGREREVPPAPRHGDGDQVALCAIGTGAVRLRHDPKACAFFAPATIARRNPFPEPSEPLRTCPAATRIVPAGGVR